MDEITGPDILDEEWPPQFLRPTEAVNALAGVSQLDETLRIKIAQELEDQLVREDGKEPSGRVTEIVAGRQGIPAGPDVERMGQDLSVSALAPASAGGIAVVDRAGETESLWWGSTIVDGRPMAVRVLAGCHRRRHRDGTLGRRHTGTIVSTPLRV